MSAKAVSEYTGKELLYRHLKELEFVEKPQALRLTASDSFAIVTDQIEWLAHDKVFASLKLIFEKNKMLSTSFLLVDI